MHPIASSMAGRRCAALPLKAPQRLRTRKVMVNAAVHARWCLDARYGSKQDATALLQEWVLTIGSKAGLTPHNTRLFSGALGVPESRLEMEVTFSSMAEWESFIAAIPLQEHKAWTQRIQGMVVDGSPVWQAHRSVPLTPADGVSNSAAWQTASSSSSSSSMMDGNAKQLVIADQIGMEDIAAWNQLTSSGHKQQRQQQQQSHQPAATPAASEPSTDVPRDWKGEPMKINPGDKLPFKFL